MTVMVVAPMNLQKVVQFVLIEKNKVIMIKKYVKKPIIIEAIQWTGKNLIDIYAFLCDKSHEEIIDEINHDFQDTCVWDNYEANIVQNGLYISTLEGKLKSDIGDYSDWEMIDGKHYCPDCYEVEVINGVYNVKAKEK